MGAPNRSGDPRALGEALRRAEESMRVFLGQSPRASETTLHLCTAAVTPEDDAPHRPRKKLTPEQKRELKARRKRLSRPCKIIPGTEAKIARMEARVAVGLPPCMPGDLDLRHLSSQLLIDAIIRIQHYEEWSPTEQRMIRMAKLWAVRWNDDEKPHVAPVVVTDDDPVQPKGGAA